MNKNKGVFRAFYDYEEGCLILSTFLKLIQNPNKAR